MLQRLAGHFLIFVFY
ncbi:hypothetical protein ECPA39_4066, partial [Escherichia coli PA39]